MADYVESHSPLFGLLSKRNKGVGKGKSALFGLLSKRTKKLGRILKPLLGLLSTQTRFLNKVLQLLLGLLPSVARKLEKKVTYSVLSGVLGKSEEFYSVTGIRYGTRTYFSWGDIGEVWEEEPARIKLIITDSLVGRIRTAEMLISNPRNIKESVYTPYKRIRIVERISGVTVFLGRVETTDPYWDDNYGQVLRVIAVDYLRELFERRVDSDYSGTPRKRSALISQIITDYSYSGTISTVGIETSGSTQTITKNYTKCDKSPVQIIEELAQEDLWDNTPTGYGYDYYVNDNQIFCYFKRASRPVGGGTNGLTIQFAGTEGQSTRSMLHDYSFCDNPKEVITRVIVRGKDSTGNDIVSTAVNTALESTYQIRKEKVDYVWGTSTQAYCDSRALALLGTESGTITRGEFGIVKYPYYGASKTIVRVGDLVRIILSTKSINADFIVLEVKYEEPPGIARIKVVSQTYGRSYSPFELASVLQGLRIGQDVSVPASRIQDLITLKLFPASGAGQTYIYTNVSGDLMLLPQSTVYNLGNLSMGVNKWFGLGQAGGAESLYWYTASGSYNHAFAPDVADIGQLGSSGNYWNKIYCNTYYGKTLSISAFQEHDDIGLVKGVKSIKMGDKDILDIDSLPEGVKHTDKFEGKEEKFINIGSLASLAIGALKQLISKVEVLEDKIKGIENKEPK